MAPESIEREILIDAPVRVVWSVVTDARHLGGWFSDSAEIDLRPGGRVALTWREHGTSHGQVERVEPPVHFSFRWMRAPVGEFREGNATLVEFSLREEGAGTRLRVTESGFPELDLRAADADRYAEENRAGWRLELGELRAYVAGLARG